TGSVPKSLPGLEIDGDRIISSDHALVLARTSGGRPSRVPLSLRVGTRRPTGSSAFPGTARHPALPSVA
ncbi:hypothetical protein ABZ595_20025, partial [Streptomyces rubradiris]|uniref:hypothetical protein n=1 Tax=Streptomyces rubradiris TaxID=285531 RepID=UPI0033C712FB